MSRADEPEEYPDELRFVVSLAPWGDPPRQAFGATKFLPVIDQATLNM